MEKWVRGLSQTTALIIGVVSLLITVAFGIFINNNIEGGSGFLPMIILCAVVGGGVGFSFLFLFKGITGKTPQENKESASKK